MIIMTDKIVRLIMFCIISMLNIFIIESQNIKKSGLIYILLWTRRYMEPFIYMHTRRISFKMMNCEFQNCYITDRGDFFEDMTDYDAILFNAIDVKAGMNLPGVRSDNQLYVFVSTESVLNYPTYEDFDWFFNYTWTYKLNSDIHFPYIIVRDKRGTVVAPKKDVHWIDTKNMKPLNESIKERLKDKKSAGAWFVSNCAAVNERIDFVRLLREELTSYDLDVDIYGSCGDSYCPRVNMDDCLVKVESDYYFYFSFENSFSDDYVTEKLLTALGHYAIPVVYGGANYTRFMPDGIYLNAKVLGQEQLAFKMNELIKDKEKYYDYFRWHEYYSYHSASESADTDPLCAFCAFLNDVNKRSERRVYSRFSLWWNENLQDNAVVTYENSDPVYKAFYISYTNTNPLPTVSVMQNVGQLVGQLYNYYFDS